MSRGPGVVQRAILAAVDEYRMIPLLEIAEQAGYDTTRLAVRQSFTRAASSLYGSGAINMWTALTMRLTSGVAMLVIVSEPSLNERSEVTRRPVERREPGIRIALLKMPPALLHRLGR